MDSGQGPVEQKVTPSLRGSCGPHQPAQKEKEPLIWKKGKRSLCKRGRWGGDLARKDAYDKSWWPPRWDSKRKKPLANEKKRTGEERNPLDEVHATNRRGSNQLRGDWVPEKKMQPTGKKESRSKGVPGEKGRSNVNNIRNVRNEGITPKKHGRLRKKGAPRGRGKGFSHLWGTCVLRGAAFSSAGGAVSWQQVKRVVIKRKAPGGGIPLSQQKGKERVAV